MFRLVVAPGPPNDEAAEAEQPADWCSASTVVVGGNGSVGVDGSWASLSLQSHQPHDEESLQPATAHQYWPTVSASVHSVYMMSPYLRWW